MLLKIILDLESFSRWGDKYVLRTNLNHLLTLFVTKIGKHATRWKEFIWKHYDSFFSARYILRCLPQGLPSLQRFTITQLRWYKEYWEGLHFPICPNIQTVSLVNIWDESDREAPTFFQQSGFSSVRDLTLGKGWDWQSVDLRFMTMFRSIHTLTLSSSGQRTINECVITSPICVKLPHLRFLRLRGWIPNEILSSIDPPDHLTVGVVDSDGTGRFLNSFDTLTGTMVATKMNMLHLEWSDHAIKEGPLSSVFKLLNNAPCLEVVYLPPRVEVMLGHAFEEFKVNHGYSFSICADGV
jgi:hypothetical protein